MYQNISPPYFDSFWNVSKYPYMIVTANKIPVPDPMAPMKSAKMVRDPIQTPPNVAAMGIYFLNIESIPESL